MASIININTVFYLDTYLCLSHLFLNSQQWRRVPFWPSYYFLTAWRRTSVLLNCMSSLAMVVELWLKPRPEKKVMDPCSVDQECPNLKTDNSDCLCKQQPNLRNLTIYSGRSRREENSTIDTHLKNSSLLAMIYSNSQIQQYSMQIYKWSFQSIIYEFNQI